MKILPGAFILDYLGILPHIHDSVFIASGAQIIGDVKIGEGSSIWFNTVIRGDVNWIRIGKDTNIQDGTVIHVTNTKAPRPAPTTIGDRVTVGHKVMIHGCTIEEDCLIGMGAILLDGVLIRKGTLVAAGSLVPPDKEFPPYSLLMGSPAKVVRELSPKERDDITHSAAHYRRLASHYF